MHRLRPDVTVDLFVGFSRFRQFYERYQQTISYYPVWIVPYRISRMYPWVNPRYLEGLKQPAGTDYYATIDKLLAEVQGVKTLGGS
jgi:hypothetical protein